MLCEENFKRSSRKNQLSNSTLSLPHSRRRKMNPKNSKQHKKDSCIVYATNWLIPWLIRGRQTLHRPRRELAKTAQGLCLSFPWILNWHCKLKKGAVPKQHSDALTNNSNNSSAVRNFPGWMHLWMLLNAAEMRKGWKWSDISHFCRCTMVRIAKEASHNTSSGWKFCGRR